MPQAVRVRAINGSVGPRNSTVKLPASFYVELDKATFRKQKGSFFVVPEELREAVKACKARGMSAYSAAKFIRNTLDMHIGEYLAGRIMKEENDKA